MADRIVLGSGKLYVAEFTTAIPDDATLEVSGNLLGYIKGGATVTYTPTVYEAIDDLGQVSKKITTSEEAHLTSGVMTWNGDTLKKLCAKATVTTASGKKTVKIGGTQDDGKKYVVRFLHEDAVDGNIRVTLVGTNDSGFSFAFATGAETVINVDFKAMPQSDGTLVIYEETT